MTLLDVIALAGGILGVLFGGRCYLELYRWAKQCQRARIAIEYKRRVKINEPLIVWLGWCNQLDPDDKGRMVYLAGGTRVAILKGTRPPGRVSRAILQHRRRRQGTKPPPAPATSAKAAA